MSELFPAYNPDDVVKLLPATEQRDSLLSDMLSRLQKHHSHEAGVKPTPSSALESTVMSNILLS